MLAYIDTLIGFAVVILIFSLLMTITTHIVSVLMNHRGGNLLWGLKTLFAQFDPERYPHLSAEAEPLARKVLTHPMISDSWLSENRFARMLGRFQPLGLMLDRFRLASAVRISEVKDILQHLAGNSLAGQPVAADINRLLPAAAGVPESAMLQRGFAVRTEADRLDDWFSSMMDRTSQRYAKYMRLWTVGFAFLFTLITGLNSPRLISDLYASHAFREALAAGTPQVTEAATAAQDAAKVGTASTEDESRLREGLESAARLKDISSHAELATFKLFYPDGFRRLPLVSRVKYWLGQGITWILLCIGAPLWYNALKSLATLRPVVASKIAAEAQVQTSGMRRVAA